MSQIQLTVREPRNVGGKEPRGVDGGSDEVVHLDGHGAGNAEDGDGISERSSRLALAVDGLPQERERELGVVELEGGGRVLAGVRGS